MLSEEKIKDMLKLSEDKVSDIFKNKTMEKVYAAARLREIISKPAVPKTFWIVLSSAFSLILVFLAYIIISDRNSPSASKFSWLNESISKFSHNLLKLNNNDVLIISVVLLSITIILFIDYFFRSKANRKR